MILIFGAFAGGGKYSLIDARVVLVKGRLPGRFAVWIAAQPMHGFKSKVLAPSASDCMVVESLAVCAVVAKANNRGLAEEYIWDCGDSITI